MAIFDTVPRSQYDLLREMYDRKCVELKDMTDRYHGLRPTHSAVQPMRVTHPQPDSGQQALQAAEAAVNNPRIAGIADNLMRQALQQGRTLTQREAMIEAKRLNDIMVGKTSAPSASP